MLLKNSIFDVIFFGFGPLVKKYFFKKLICKFEIYLG